MWPFRRDIDSWHTFYSYRDLSNISCIQRLCTWTRGRRRIYYISMDSSEGRTSCDTIFSRAGRCGESQEWRTKGAETNTRCGNTGLETKSSTSTIFFFRNFIEKITKIPIDISQWRDERGERRKREKKCKTYKRKRNGKENGKERTNRSLLF